MNKITFVLLGIILLSECASRDNNSTPEITQNPAALSVKGEGEWWIERHQTILSRLEKDPELILIGNSIFHSLDNENRQEVWEKYLDQYRAVNMGFSGDRTENVIWRLQNGSIDNINPKVAVILIGTNNTDGNHYLNISTPEELAGGIWKICEIVQEKLPDTKILIMGILPYGYKPNHRNNINKATNSLVSRFPDKNPHISYVEISQIYLDNEGKVNNELMPDYLHPNPAGHLLMFEALEKDIAKLMKD